MIGLDAAILAERAASLQRHLRRVQDRLPEHRMLADHDVIEDDLAARLVRVAGFRNVLVHAYADLDLALVHDAALHGPADLTAFLAALRDHLDDTTAAGPG